VTLSHIADEIEEGVRALTGHPGIEKGDVLKAGMGFPTGLCLNSKSYLSQFEISDI
jgi:methionyl aminopeptidase